MYRGNIQGVLLYYGYAILWQFRPFFGPKNTKIEQKLKKNHQKTPFFFGLTPKNTDFFSCSECKRRISHGEQAMLRDQTHIHDFKVKAISAQEGSLNVQNIGIECINCWPSMKHRRYNRVVILYPDDNLIKMHDNAYS